MTTFLKGFGIREQRKEADVNKSGRPQGIVPPKKCQSCEGVTNYPSRRGKEEQSSQFHLHGISLLALEAIGER